MIKAKREMRYDPEVRLAKPHFWSAVAGAVLGTVASGIVGEALFGDDGGGGGGAAQAAEISAEQRELFKRQADLAAFQLEISKEMVDLWRTETLPLIRAAAADVSVPGGRERAIAEAVGDVRGQYASSEERLKRAIELSRGPDDPVYAQLLAQLKSAEAADVAEAIRRARATDEERTWARRLQAIAAYSDPGSAARASAATAGSLYGSAGAGLGAAARNALIAQQLADERAARSGYAAASIFGPAIRQGIQEAFKYATTPAPTASGPGGRSEHGVIDDWTPFDYPDYYREGGRVRAIRAGRGYADGGGVIEGPGTGTSDSIPTRASPGSYVLSADTVRAIGTKKIDDLIERSGVRPGTRSSAIGVPIRVSDGEAVIPPETVAYYGEEFFNRLQQKYHRPVAAQQGMANGGAIRMRELPRSVEDAILRSFPSRAIGRS